MPRHASYSLVAEDAEARIFYIVDLDLPGGLSVTNDAAHVVATMTVQGQYPIRIIYRDTMKCWAELCHERGRFTHFRAVEEPEPELFDES